MIRHLVSVLPVLAAVLLAAPSAAPAQQSAILSRGLGLHVVDAADAPIAGARVVLGTGAEGLSSESGWVRLPGVQPGRVFVLVTRIGYRPTEFSLEVPATGGLEVDVELEAAPVVVEGVTAVGRAENRSLAIGGFYRRKEMGMGTFLTREDIAGTGAMRTSEVFRRVRGVRVIRGAGDTYKLQTVRYGLSLSQTMGAAPRSGRRRPPAGSSYACEMLVFVDGMQQQVDGIDDIQMESLEAIEVYRGAGEIPPEYKLMNATCGVVLLWTRSGR